MSKGRYVFDIEANGFLNVVTEVWCLCLTDYDTGETYTFSDHDDSVPSMEEGRKFFFATKNIIGHNIIEYDNEVLLKVLGWEIPDSIIVTDTLIMSRVLDYKRFGGSHKLAKFGEYFKRPKPEHEEWDKYSPEMLHRCREDVAINVMAFELLLKEMSALAKVKPVIKHSLRNEHDVVEFCVEAEKNGWLFDRAAGVALLPVMEDEMTVIENAIEPGLKTKVKRVDKEPRLIEQAKKLNGHYNMFTARYFGIEQNSSMTDQLVVGDYNRIEFLTPDMGNIDYVKEYLYEIGWEPLEWNWKKVKGRLQKTTPKLCTMSLDKLGEVGEMVDKYYCVRSRHSILTGWLAELDSDDRLHGRCFTIGTPTARARHSVIVNVPSPNARYGKEMRDLFIVPEGRSIVGADSSGNQMRALCHYIGNDEFTDEVINGDVHQRNADILGVPRFQAKPFLYAFLFGGGDGKLSLIVKGVRDAAYGKELKATFIQNTPGLGDLTARVVAILKQTSNYGKRLGYIPALDGRKIYTESDHKALNYLLQSCEAVTCKAAVAWMWRKFKAEKLDVRPLIFYHDEVQLDVADRDIDRVREICKEAFRDAPKAFGVDIMDGETMVGKTWYDTH